MNKRNKKIAWIIGISIIALIVLLPYLHLENFAIYGSESDLIYKTHGPGTCYVAISNIDNTNTIKYPIIVTISNSGNSIYEKLDGTQGSPSLPPLNYDEYHLWGSNECDDFGLIYSGELDWNKLIEYGSVDGLIDYCPNGAIDPPNDGIVNYKCNGYCKPDSSVCTSDITLATCVGGTRIEHQDCANGCENGACKTTEKVLIIQTDQEAYSLGENVNVIGTFSAVGVGIEGVAVTAQLIRSGVVDEHQGTTNVNGIVNFTFIKPSAGETTVKLVIPNYEGRIYGPTTKIIQIIGNSVQYEVATYSPTQYSSKNITFTVKMKDSKGLDITPSQLTNLHAVNTLTQGSVVGIPTVIYKGEGLYEVNSIVEGSGRFVGKLSFSFEGLPQSSPIVEIDVRPMGISIDTKEIAPGAYLYDNLTYTIKIFDSSGEPLTPENIEIKVSLPSGTTAKLIPFSQITKVDTGVYTFSYSFTEVEKHTFDIYADYQNYARGSARASVAVSGKGDDVGPGIAGIGNTLTYILYAGLGALVLYFIFKKRKKSK